MTPTALALTCAGLAAVGAAGLLAMRFGKCPCGGCE